jgi:hypothetical protein
MRRVFVVGCYAFQNVEVAAAISIEAGCDSSFCAVTITNSRSYLLISALEVMLNP